MTASELIKRAEIARLNAYAPYSKFSVGAALLAKSGKVYVGCNLENAAFTPTVCAERVAFFKALSEGEREFSSIAIVGGKAGESSTFCPPCGVCRQVMAEFCDSDFCIFSGTTENYRLYRLRDILPLAFSLDDPT